MTAEKTLLRCSHCSKEFKYDSERRRHEQSHFPQFQCKVCSKNFSFISALRRHEKQHERVGTVTCNDCGREFRDQVLLKRHSKYAHGGSYTCTKCDTIFYSEPALRTHMQTHKSESERRYQCSYAGCSKKFNFAHHLKHHELTHTDTKQHYCKICGKGFIQSHHLKAHLKTHSADSSLYCTFPDCHKKFATEYAKKRHVTKYHMKTDSGISSDSNSAYDTSIPNILKSNPTVDDDNMPPHEEKIYKTENQTHASLYTDNEEQEVIPEDLSLPNASNEKLNEQLINDTNGSIDNDVSNCQLALGTCIMDEEGEKCVCVQINKNINEDYDFTPIETIQMNKLSINSINCEPSECCGGTCSSRNDNLSTRDVMPEMEYKADGTVKIKEFFDIDFDLVDIGQKNDRSIRNDGKFVPYNSCKAVLGNCIVSGNGTIGDGCLCAKMIIDEQVNSQEIEDITPHPNNYSL